MSQDTPITAFVGGLAFGVYGICWYSSFPMVCFLVAVYSWWFNDMNLDTVLDMSFVPCIKKKNGKMLITNISGKIFIFLVVNGFLQIAE